MIPAREQLLAMMRSGRLVHACLLAGPGSGKERLARWFARWFLCPDRKTEDTNPCASCLSCRLAEAGSHPDFRVWEGERGAWRVEQVRDLIAASWRQPGLGLRSVHLLKDVHLLTVPAANALLKVLEDPPPGCLFLLLADDTGSLPATLLSRCQIIPWEESLSGGDGAPPGESVAEAVEDAVRAIVEAARRGKGSHLLALARELAVKGEAVPVELAKCWRDAVALAVAAREGRLEQVGQAGQVAQVGGGHRALAGVGVNSLLRAWELTDELSKRLASRVNGRLAWEWFLLELAEIVSACQGST